MSKGDIVLVRFPYTNLSDTKLRPAIIISNGILNSDYDDLILLAITSQELDDPNLEIEISNNDLEEGSIPKTSYIRLSKIVSLDKSLIISKVASIKEYKALEVYNKFCNLIK